MEANKETKNNEQSEFEEIEEKDLKAVSGGCGTSTPEPEPEPVHDPHNCPAGGLHECMVNVAKRSEGICKKCSQFLLTDEHGGWITVN